MNFANAVVLIFGAGGVTWFMFNKDNLLVNSGDGYPAGFARNACIVSEFNPNWKANLTSGASGHWLANYTEKSGSVSVYGIYPVYTRILTSSDVDLFAVLVSSSPGIQVDRSVVDALRSYSKVTGVCLWRGEIPSQHILGMGGPALHRSLCYFSLSRTNFVFQRHLTHVFTTLGPELRTNGTLARFNCVSPGGIDADYCAPKGALTDGCSMTAATC